MKCESGLHCISPSKDCWIGLLHVDLEHPAKYYWEELIQMRRYGSHLIARTLSQVASVSTSIHQTKFSFAPEFFSFPAQTKVVLSRFKSTPLIRTSSKCIPFLFSRSFLPLAWHLRLLVRKFCWRSAAVPPTIAFDNWKMPNTPSVPAAFARLWYALPITLLF